jgi:RNA polymerase sigma-70 factor (ECF subfamily)
LLEQTAIIDANELLQSRKETELIESAKQGNQTAFHQLYQLHVKRVYGICWRMLADNSVAEDVTQEVFVQVWLKLSNFRGESKFSTWLHSVATNTVLSHLRKNKNWLQRVFHIEDQINQDVEGFSSMPELTDMDKLIMRLPERARHVFVLFAIEGYRHEEISVMLDMAIGTSKAQFHRAKTLLQEWLTV